MTNPFIGRGEMVIKDIIHRLMPGVGSREQCNIVNLIPKEEYDFLDKEIQQHNFDLYFQSYSEHVKPMVVEVNYHHKEKAAIKARQLFEPMVSAAGIVYVTIDDWNCRKRGVFWTDKEKKHPVITWNDYRDVIDALELAGVNPRQTPVS